ncbi:MAG: thioesterase family protein [Fusobacterium sp.]|uniref:thioesterase family protein n=1 Tax=Fusobacterium sp. TaxID=68766 RepID=UPI00399AF1CC
MLKEGITLTLEKVVKAEETAAKVASGALEVFSTPMLIAFMEQTSFELAQQYMKEGDTTVGVSVNIKHLKANLVGDRLKCISTLEKIDGKRLDFLVKVYHNENVVGEGEHSRFIVNEEKFLGKLKG